MAGLNSPQLTFCDNLPKRRQPRIGYMHLCIGFHEDATDRNEYVLATKYATYGWQIDIAGKKYTPGQLGFTITQWAELPIL